MRLEVILLTAVVIIFAQAWVYRRFGLKGVSYSRFFADAARFEGERTELVEQIANDKPLPVPWLRLESSLPSHLHFDRQDNLSINAGQIFQNHKSLFSLMPYTKIKRRHFITCAKRGYYRLASATMTCGDITGMNAATRALSLDSTLLVYPRIVPVEDIPLPSHSWLGNVTVKRWIMEDPFMPAGIREYQAGDPLHRIHWKATARTGKLQVQKKDFTSEHYLQIYVNFEVTRNMWDAVTDPELVERGISYAASVAHYTIARGVDTGFGCNGQLADAPGHPVRIRPGAGGAHLEHMLETMAKLEIVRSQPIDYFLAEDIENGVANTDILLITAFVSEKIQMQIEELRRLGNAVGIVRLSSTIKGREGSTDE